jgi:hypothetical protein
MHGICVVDGVVNDLIAGSGQTFLLRRLDAPYPALPDLRDSYRTLTRPACL